MKKRSLASILRDHGPLSVSDAVDIALDVCDELANVHANGVVHGDLGVHRVRLAWPRASDHGVDIFVLGEDDSAASSFRASAVGALVAPEQRDGRKVDLRADVWAVGALLHWMLAGVAPGIESVAGALGRAPSTLIVTIEACLADDPDKRPQSVDEIAEVIGSFASSPPDRFEQLARRRSVLASATRPRSSLSDVDRVLHRLDEAAIEREVAAATSRDLSETTPVEARLMATLRQTMVSATFESGARVDGGSRMDDLFADDSDDDDEETVIAFPRYSFTSEVTSSSTLVARPSDRISSTLEASPASLSTAALSTGPFAAASEAANPLSTSRLSTNAPSSRALSVNSSSTTPLSTTLRSTPASIAPATISASPPAMSVSPSRSRWAMVLGPIGAIIAVSIGVGIGVQLVDRAPSSNASAPAREDVTPGVVESPVSAPAPASPTNEALQVVTPSTLPDAPSTLPEKAPAAPSTASGVTLDAPSTRPDALPDARGTEKRSSPMPLRPQPSTSVDGKKEGKPSAPPNWLSDALR